MQASAAIRPDTFTYTLSVAIHNLRDRKAHSQQLAIVYDAYDRSAEAQIIPPEEIPHIAAVLPGKMRKKCLQHLRLWEMWLRAETTEEKVLLLKKIKIGSAIADDKNVPSFSAMAAALRYFGAWSHHSESVWAQFLHEAEEEQKRLKQRKTV